MVLIAILSERNNIQECIACMSLETTGPCSCEVYFLAQAVCGGVL